MILTDEERAKFARWLLEDAESSKQLITQLKQLPGTEAAQKKLTVEAMAQTLVAIKLQSIEGMTISK